MTTGLSNGDLHDMSDTRKTAVINNELLRLNVDIAALQETRIADSGSLREKDYTFLWQGKKAEETRQHGVGFAIKNSLMKTVEQARHATERLLSIRINTTDGPVNMVCVYAPTLQATAEVKN